MKKITILLLLALSAQAHGAGDIYVSNSGSDEASCGAIGNPCATIDYAINTRIADSNGGWNVILRAGVYQGTGNRGIRIAPEKTGTAQAWNSLRSYPGEWAIIDGQNTCPDFGFIGMRPLIANSYSPNHHEGSAVFAQYWVFERLELRGGGNTGSVDLAAAIMWTKGPLTVRYCYIHDNLNNDGDYLPAGLYANSCVNCTIEFNWFEDNGAAINPSANCANITMGPNACGYVGEPSCHDSNWFLWKNSIRYNLVKSVDHAAVGIRTKSDQQLTVATRDGSETTNMEYGDKIHHNIIIKGAGDLYPAILYQQDYVNIYQNIIDMNGNGGGENWENHSISARRRCSPQVDTIQTSIWNNTIYNQGGGDIIDWHEGVPDTVAQWWVLNNILDRANGWWAPVTYGGRNNYCSAYSGQSFDTTLLRIDRNYYYRPANANAMALNNSTASAAAYYTVPEWEALQSSADLFTQDDQESGSNRLFVGSSGADKYRTVGSHNVGEPTKTVANTGLNTAHPYLPGIALPDFIGATRPTDDAWVAGVLGMDINFFADQIDGSDPTWIEGGAGDTTAPTISSPLPTGHQMCVE